MRKKLMAWLLAIGMTVASLTPAQGVMAYGAETYDVISTETGNEDSASEADTEASYPPHHGICDLRH